MCILCVVQRWSRRVATMLPWLVIPLIFFWMVSQLLPPCFRFEVTSPRLACVVILLITLFWYEVLMPQLSAWRARRSARIQEQRRSKALELAKLKKAAIRRCRNCYTPYRDQNPGCGKFMCSYCGHISKRPVLDMHGWQDWPGESVSIPRYWRNGGRGADGRCMTEKSYTGVLVFGCQIVGSFFVSVQWVWRKVFRVGSRDGDSADGESVGSSSKRGENGGSFQESKGEKARRKAEEKRQARLEREMLEEEERKQREEVARLVEERRKLRDEKLEAERPRLRGSQSVDGERENRKEAERRKRDKRREKDKGSSKSNSDGEEHEKKSSKETEKKREFDKKSEIERQRVLVENLKSQALEGGNGNKAMANKTRYLDRVKGTFLSSSRGYGASFFGRNAQTTVTVTKVSKPAVVFSDHGQNFGTKKDSQTAANASGKTIPNGDHRPAGTDVQLRATAPKKSWHQLFTRSSAVSQDPDTNNAPFGNQNYQMEARSLTDQRTFPSYPADNQLNFQQSFGGYSSSNGLLNGHFVSAVATDSMFPPIKEPVPNSVVEEAEQFEDPCYDPDPYSYSLLGPISDQLDEFPLEMGAGVTESKKLEGPRVLKNVNASAEVNKPSPIESPLSRLRGSEERQISSTQKSQKLHAPKSDELSNAQGSGTWQMWGTPLARDGLGLAGGPSSWFSPLVPSKSNQEDITHSLGSSPTALQVTTGSPLPSILTQKSSVGNLQNGGTFSPIGPGLNGNDPWGQNSPFQSPLAVDGETHFLPLDLIDNIAQNEVTYCSPRNSAAVHPFEVSQANGWSKEEQTRRGINETANSTTPVRPPNVGGLFSTGPDVQSVWSFNHQ